VVNLCHRTCHLGNAVLLLLWSAKYFVGVRVFAERLQSDSVFAGKFGSGVDCLRRFSQLFF